MKKLLLTFALGAASMGAMAQWNNDSTELDSYDKFRIGGYGELVAAFKNYGTNRFTGGNSGNTTEHRNTISMPRFVIAGDYKFNKHWIVGVEIEFEAGGTGTEYELENTENGEYETEVEKGGEVALEQFHLTYHLNNAFNVRAGHMIVPVGLTNSHHEPINFFGTVRPEGETTIIPSTWHETGIEILGQFGKKWASFDYEAMVVTGLNANGFDRNEWVAGGKQGIFEDDNFTSPAYVGRLNYRGVPGLRLGASFYYCRDTGANSDKTQTYSGFRAPLRIWSVDATYQNQWVVARMNLMGGHLGNSSRVSSKNSRLSSNSQYSRLTPVAKRAVSYGGEAGLRLKGFVMNEKMPDLTPFFRYEYYNPQESVVVDSYNSTTADARLKTNMWVLGINYKPLPFLIIKADYTKRIIGDRSADIGSGRYNNENEFALGIAFTGWFLSDRTVKDLKARHQIKKTNDELAKVQRKLAEMQEQLDRLSKEAASK